MIAAFDMFRKNVHRPFSMNEYYGLTIPLNKKDHVKYCRKVIALYKRITAAYRMSREHESTVTSFDTFFNKALPTQLIEYISKGKLDENQIYNEYIKGFNASRYAEAFRLADDSDRLTTTPSVNESVEYVTMISQHELVYMCMQWLEANKFKISCSAMEYEKLITSIMYTPVKVEKSVNGLRSVIKTFRDLDGEIVQGNHGVKCMSNMHLIIIGCDKRTKKLCYKIF